MTQQDSTVRGVGSNSSAVLSQLDKQHVIHPGTSIKRNSERGPIIHVSGKGSKVYDTAGKAYIDGYAAMGAQIVGYGRREIIDAITQQLSQLPCSTNYYHFSNPAAIQLAAKLAEITPGDLTRTFFTCGGSEANESAIKMTRCYFAVQGTPQKHKIISRRGGYHGLTIATMTATGIPQFQKNFGPMAPGFVQVEPFDPDDLEAAIEAEGADTVAAFFAEPILGVGGHKVPPDDYFARVRAICDRHDVLLVADEVVTGFGRTGKMFGVQNWNVVPDVMTFAKGLTSGYLPLGAAVVSRRIADGLEVGLGDGLFSHGFTYSGHAACCAAALASLEIVEREDLPARAAETGAYLRKQLEGLASSPIVGEIRGLGMTAAVELWKDPKARVAFDTPGAAGALVNRMALERGVIIRPSGDTITIRPPLVLTREEVDTLVNVVAEGIRAVEKELA
ncbi:MAG: aspartate aminotransferase family protein [Hyphomicrobiales bacterium]|nr:aspartate aminotransferase family protein [Hyphomicrobiales bacterium]